MTGGSARLPSIRANILHALGDVTGWNEKRCISCLDPYIPKTEGLAGLCPDCLGRTPRRLAGYCPLCGEIAAQADSAPALCGQCLKNKPPWCEFRFYGEFSGQLRALLHRGKFASDSACLDLLGRMLLVACYDLPRPDAIIPMPLHALRLRQRGYNQCREIARPLARALNCPIRDQLLFRTRHTMPQTGLSREARLHNLGKAFAAAPDVQGLKLLLVDDTATTGTSLRMASLALLQAGAARVDVAVLAHTSLHSPLLDQYIP